MNTRVVVIVGSVIAALLVAVTIALFLVLGEMQRQADNASYQDCMARYGFEADAPAPPMSDDRDADAYIDSMVDAAEACSTD